MAVDVAQRAAQFIQHLAQGHVNEFKLRQPALPLGVWQRSEQLVLFRIGGNSHHGTLDQV